MNFKNLSCVAAICIGFWAMHAPVRAFDTELLVNSGPSSNRLDLVILGDGYRAEDQAQLTSDANTALSVLFGEDIWQRYRDYVNVKLVHVESNEAGADDGSAGGMRDTALGSFYNCNGIDRLLCADSNAVLNAAMADAPEFDQIVVIVNDTKYGGGGGQYATTSIAPSATDIAVHELGHSLFDLADEYDSPYPGFPACDPATDCPEPNATLFSTLADVKWSHWVEGATPMPTPDLDENDALVGAFEGARYQTTGVFRPLRNCLMRSLGRHLCPVCAEAGVLSFYSYSGPVDASVPAAAVTMTTAQTQQFRIDGPRPDPDTLSFTWRIDGNPIATNTTGVLDLMGSGAGPGDHTLSVDITDNTKLVREDPGARLVDSRSWSLTVKQAVDWRSFEDPSRPWTTVFPFNVQTVADASHGVSSLQVNGCLFVPINGPLFNTSELQPTGNRLSLDVKLPGKQPVPFWNGNLQVLVTIPGALVFNAFVGNVTLLAGPLNKWETHSVTIPAWLRPVLAGSFPNARFTIAVQTANCLQPMLIDNLRIK